MLVVLLLGLTACNGSTGSINIITVEDTAPSATLSKACASPVRIPQREINQSEAEAYWGQDRRHLATCRDRHNALVRSVDG